MGRPVTSRRISRMTDMACYKLLEAALAGERDISASVLRELSRRFPSTISEKPQTVRQRIAKNLRAAGMTAGLSSPDTQPAADRFDRMEK